MIAPRRLVDRVLCRMNQHRLVFESVEWARPGEALYLALPMDIPRTDQNGLGQTRCTRLDCRLIYPWTFLRGERKPNAGAAAIEDIRSVARRALGILM